MKWALLLIGLAGCGESAADWHGDARFTATERASIEAGQAWLSDHSRTARLTFDWTYEAGTDPPPHTIVREPGPHGSGECVVQTVYLGLDAPGVRPEDVEGLAAHELAHCTLGFVDDPDTDGIMRVVSPMRWTDREEAQCHVTTACGPR